jgi:hypothetical protein
MRAERREDRIGAFEQAVDGEPDRLDLRDVALELRAPER